MEASDIASQKGIQTQPSVRKVMTLFWDAQRPILEHSQEKGTTVNSDCYSEIVEISYLSQMPRTIVEGVTMFHDNAHLHTGPPPFQSVHQLTYEVLMHPPFSPIPDLVPSDSHPCGSLQDTPRAQ
jgi:hypothetical protein